MWTPTHAQVTVHRARNLVPKGKGGTNDAYVTIQLGKEKYQTSVKERSENPEWHEECDMPIGSAKEVTLNVFHRSFLGLDDFLGHVALPLEQFQIYERPRSRWYSLKGRPGKGKKGDTKYRGEIECKVTFVVQSKKNSSEGTEVLRRAGSIKNLANTVSEKFKLPVRSSSFKDKEDGSKKKKAFIEPLVRSPSDRLSLPPTISLDLSGPVKADPALHSSYEGFPDPEPNAQMEPAAPTPESFTEMSVDAVPRKRIAPPKPARTHESLTAKLDQKDDTPQAFSTINLPPIRPRKTAPEKVVAVEPSAVAADRGDLSPTTQRHIGTIKECPDAETDPRLTPLQNQNKQLSFSEADLNKRWRSSDVNRRVCSEEADGLIRYKQPVYKTPALATVSTSPPKAVETSSGNEAPLLRRTTSDAEAKFVQKGKPDSAVDDLKPLKDTREMTKSLSKLDEEVEMPTDFTDNQTNGLHDRSRSSVGSSLPESIPEESSIQDTHTEVTHMRTKVISNQSMDKTHRRHSIQVGAEEIHVPAHVLQDVTDCHRKAVSLSPELLDEYRGITREELIKLVHTQKSALYSKDMYIRDLESYIDNLLVRVMENTPRILQNPFSTDVTLVMTPASDSVIKTAPAKRKSHNPFKLRK